MRDEPAGAGALSLIVSAALALAGVSYVRAHHDADVARYAYRPTLETLLLSDWKSGRWRELPAARAELAGEAEEPFSVQWAGTAEQIAGPLAAAGWEAPRPWASKAALLWLLPSAQINELPVLPKLDRGERQKLTFVKVLNPQERVVIRLWLSREVVDGVAAGEARPLWNGMVTLEQLCRPAGMVTVAATRSDFAAAAGILAVDVRKQRVSAERRERAGVPVLLLW